MSFKKLNLEQQQRYNAVCSRLGISEGESTHQPVEHPEGKVVVYSSDPLESDVPPKLVPVKSIQHLKTMLGLDQVEASSEKDIAHPKYKLDKHLLTKTRGLIDADELAASLTAEQHEQVATAARAYIHGDASQVKHFVPLINALHFPTEMAVFASTAARVIDGTAKIVSPDGKIVKWHDTSVVMGPNAKIEQEADFMMHTESLVSAVGATGDLPINNTPPPYKKAAAAGSFSKQPAQAGGGDGGTVANRTTGKCEPYCSVSPTNGKDGTKGPDGGPGSGGADGGKMSDLTITITESLTGKIVITASGGNGQDGGKGGPGADGGPGGPPGEGPPPCGKANPGAQGPGGTGGRGGDAGNGGKVGIITINIPAAMPQPPVDLIAEGGKPGQPGGGGENGKGSSSGGPSLPGNPGDPSDAPKVIFKRLPPQ